MTGNSPHPKKQSSELNKHGLGSIKPFEAIFFFI